MLRYLQAKKCVTKYGRSTVIKANVLRRDTLLLDLFARLHDPRTRSQRRQNKNVHSVCVSISRFGRSTCASSFYLLARMHDRPLVRKLHLSDRDAYSRLPLSPCFFRCLGAPLRTGNTSPKDNYNKSCLHNIV